jgi:hypothetical protein
VTSKLKDIQDIIDYAENWKQSVKNAPKKPEEEEGVRKFLDWLNSQIKGLKKELELQQKNTSR